MTNDDSALSPTAFPQQKGHPSEAYRVALDLLARRAPVQALEVLAPALEAEPAAVSLRSLRAWAYFLRVQLAKAEEDLRLSAAMSGDPEHETAVLRVERRLAEAGETSYADLT